MKVKVQEITRNVCELDMELPIYLHWQDENALDRYEMIGENFRLKIKYEFNGFNIDVSSFNILDATEMTYICSKRHFMFGISDALHIVKDILKRRDKLLKNKR